MTLTTMTAFHLHDVTKKFGRTTALDAVTCDIPFGHVHDHLVLAGADVPFPSDMSVRTLMDIAAARWTTWDEPFATDQVDRFGVDPKARFSTLSRGQKTLASLVIGLGVRA